MSHLAPSLEVLVITRLLEQIVIEPRLALFVDVDFFNRMSEEAGLPLRLIKEDDGN